MKENSVTHDELGAHQLRYLLPASIILIVAILAAVILKHSYGPMYIACGFALAAIWGAAAWHLIENRKTDIPLLAFAATAVVSQPVAIGSSVSWLGIQSLGFTLFLVCFLDSAILSVVIFRNGRDNETKTPRHGLISLGVSLWASSILGVGISALTYLVIL